MGNMTILTVFIVIINVMMWFASIAMADVNPGGVMCFNIEGTIIDNSITRSGNLSVSEDPLGSLPDEQSGPVGGGATNIFTDIFNSIATWVRTAPGLKYVYAVIAAPYNILSCMGLPNLFIAGLGTIWYVISFLVFISYMWGREQ